MKDNGITVSDDIADEMAQYVADNYEDLHLENAEDIDDDKVSDVLISYYDAYLKSLNP